MAQKKMSAADFKMKIRVLIQSLKSNILISISIQMDWTFRRAASAIEEQLRSKASMVAQGGRKFNREAEPIIPPSQKKGPKKA